MDETTWDRHPANGNKARVWKRENCNGCEYPWFYRLPKFDGQISCGSIARTWDQAMAEINKAYMERWIRQQTKIPGLPCFNRGTSLMECPHG